MRTGKSSRELDERVNLRRSTIHCARHPPCPNIRPQAVPPTARRVLGTRLEWKAFTWRSSTMYSGSRSNQINRSATHQYCIALLLPLRHKPSQLSASRLSFWKYTGSTWHFFRKPASIGHVQSNIRRPMHYPRRIRVPLTLPSHCLGSFPGAWSQYAVRIRCPYVFQKRPWPFCFLVNMFDA
jgi:hypothetical protein